MSFLPNRTIRRYLAFPQAFGATTSDSAARIARAGRIGNMFRPNAENDVPIMPETARYHLYDVDSLAMVVTDRSHWVAQERLAQIATSAAVQADYNQIKGSIPVLRNPDLSKMDSCSRESWKLFARGSSVQVPSLVHRMATDEISRDAFIAEVHRFFMEDQVTVEDTQHRLGAILRALTKIQPENDATQDVHR